jgi:ABC-type nitrate/sulfonate/bicarbonate transport system substrate-binding protein
MQNIFADRRTAFRRGLRHSALAVLALAVGTLGLAAGARAETLRIGKSVPVAFSFVPLDVGIQKGIFKKNGLDIKYFSFHGGGKEQQAMAAGSIDVGLGSGPAMGFITKGAPVKAIAAMAGPPLLLVIIVRPDGPKTVADLKGKKISVSTRGSLTYWLTRETARRQGWGPDGINAVPLGRTKGQIIAMEKGETDGMVTDIATALTLQKQHKARILVRFNDVKDFLMHVIFATDDSIAKRPDDLRKFLKAWFETIHYMRDHKAETVKIAAPVIHASPEITSEVYDQLMPMFLDDGHFPPKAMKVMSESYVTLGILKKEPDPKTLYTEKFLP